MTLLRHLWIVLITAAPLGGCVVAQPPTAELQQALAALAQAESAGAPELATAEFDAAHAALHRAEELIADQEYDDAAALLPVSIAAARKAEDLAMAARKELAPVEPATEPSATPPLPPPAPSVKPPKSITLLTTVTVTGGETLWILAARPEVYGDPLLWPLLYQANRDQIKDPRQIYSGQTLSIPRGLSESDREDARQRARTSEIVPLDTVMRALSGGNR